MTRFVWGVVWWWCQPVLFSHPSLGVQNAIWSPFNEGGGEVKVSRGVSCLTGQDYFAVLSLSQEAIGLKSIRVRRLAQGHLETQLGGAGDRTSNLLVASQLALPPEPPPAHK